MNKAPVLFELADKRVYVAGHKGMVGAAICNRLAEEGCAAVLTASRSQLDLTDQHAVDGWFSENSPDAVFLAAAKVGGILANDSAPADFLYENLMIEANVIHAAFAHGVKKLLFLGSSCIYPRDADNPITEDALLTGPLEPTNQWYAVAKIAGVKLCQAYRRQHGVDFISAMPTNLYGENDNYDLASSHVLPALVRKAIEAKHRGAPHFEIWGTGAPRREFLHVRDCADALVFLMKRYSGEDPVNVGYGEDISIMELAMKVTASVGLPQAPTRDLSKPDGVARKLMSGERLRALGWRPRITLDDGVAEIVAAYNAGMARSSK